MFKLVIQNPFFGRKMLYILFFIIGVAFIGLFNDLCSAIIVLLGVLIFILNSRKRYPYKKIIICLLLLVAGGLYYYLFNSITIFKYENIDIKNQNVSIVVLSEPDYINNKVTFEGKIKGYNKKAIVTLYDTPYFSCYDTIELKGNIYSVSSNKENYYSKGIYYKVVSYDKNVIVTSGKGLLKFIFNVKQKMLYLIDNIFSYNTSMLIKGVLIGDDTLRTEEFSDSLKKLSLTHVVVVSGMHFSIITTFLLFLMRRLMIGRKTASLLTIPVSFIIALFIGFTPSVVRVLIMTSVLSLADLFDRDKVSDIYLLLLTALLMILFNIYYIHNIAFILSFSSVAGILMYHKTIMSKIKKIPYKIRDIISTTLSANVFTLPFVLYYFRGLPILSVFANLIVVPLVSFIMIYGLICVLLALIYIDLGKVLGYPLDFITSACVDFIIYFSKIPFGYFKTLSLDIYFISLYYLFIYILNINFYKKFKSLVAISIIVYICINLFYPLDRAILPYGTMYVMCGKNSGKSIITYKDKSIFINASLQNGTFDYSLIKEECNNIFDVYVAFGADAIKFIENNSINVKELYVPSGFLHNEFFSKIIRERSEKVIVVDKDINISFYDFNLTLKPYDSYNILEADILCKDNKIVTTNSEISSFDKDTKYIVSYYMLERYIRNENVLNCFKEEVERIRL